MPRKKKKALDPGFPARLRTARRNKNWSQADLAKNLSSNDDKVTSAAVSSWERARHEPELYRWTIMADKLGVPYAELFAPSATNVSQSGVEYPTERGDAVDKEVWKEFGKLEEKFEQLRRAVEVLQNKCKPARPPITRRRS